MVIFQVALLKRVAIKKKSNALKARFEFKSLTHFRSFMSMKFECLKHCLEMNLITN